MKRLLIFLAALFASTVMMQAQNFKVENGNIYWQKIYEQDVDIKAMLINSGKFTDITQSNGMITARIKPAKVDANGRSAMEIPIYIRDDHMTAFVRIQQKENRYRVTVDQFVFIDMVDSPLGQQGEETSLEAYAIKRDGSLKPYFVNTASVIIDEALTSLFIPTNDLGNDDW